MKDGETIRRRITCQAFISPPSNQYPALHPFISPLHPFATTTHPHFSDQIKLKPDGVGPGLCVVSDCHGALTMISHWNGLQEESNERRREKDRGIETERWGLNDTGIREEQDCQRERVNEREKTDEYGPAASRSIPLIAQLAQADDMNAIWHGDRPASGRPRMVSYLYR